MLFGGLLGRYREALREEPRLRYFFLWTLIDDLGTAVSTWAGTVFVSTLVRTPEDMATFVIPMLWARLLGGALAGPLADWSAKRDPAALPRWRYKIVVWRYLVLFAGLVWLVALIAVGRTTLSRMIAFFVLQQFVSTLGAPTLGAFFVDLLQKSEPVLRPDGTPDHDESGEPKQYKTHLLTGSSLLSQVSAAAGLLGLLAGGFLLNRVARGRVWPLLGFDALTFLVFAVGTAVSLHPTRSAREFRLRQLLPERELASPTGEAPPTLRSALWGAPSAALRSAADSLRALWRFGRDADNAPFLALLVVGWSVTVLGAFYEPRLLCTGALGLSLEGFRRVQLASSVATVLAYSAVVSMGARVRSLGRLYALAVLLDGAAMALAGFAAGRAQGRMHAVAVAAGVTGFVLDAALSVVLGALAGLAQKTVSSAALRGRILGGVLLVQSVALLFAERAYPALAARLGQTGLLFAAGLAQMAVVVGALALRSRGPTAFRIVTGTAEGQ